MRHNKCRDSLDILPLALIMDFTSTFRLSFVTFTSVDNSGAQTSNLQPSVSLSKKEVVHIGQTKTDADISKITLSCFWKRLGRNQFCLPDGGVVNSNTTLLEYCEAAKPHYSTVLADLADRKESPVYTICYKETTRVPNPQKAGDASLDLTLHTFESKLGDFGALPDASAIDPNAIAAAPTSTGSRPGQMKVGDWNEVIVGNKLLNGFAVNPITHELFKARDTAFKLNPNPIHPFLFSPGTLSFAETNDIKNRAKAATKASPVTKIELGLSRGRPSSSDKQIDHVKTASTRTPSIASSTGADSADSTDSDPTLPTDEPLQHLFPLWEVCDDSNIKIETISTEQQLASARQGFSSVDVQAAVATSAVSFAANASAGFATSTKTASADSTGTQTKQMHATYQFPRVRLFLDEESISLSDDCAEAIAQINTKRSYQALRDFYERYGQLFVTRVKLGGRLRATRFLLDSEATSMHSTENAWKASLAASFSTVTTSGSANSEVQGASSSEGKSASSSLNDSICWEAHGGDTTLGNNPSAWCSTVDAFWNWRIVEQEVVVPIENIISKIPGYEKTRALFASIMLDNLFNMTSLDISWNGAKGAALGCGISSNCEVSQPGDILRASALTAGLVETALTPQEPEFQWSVIHTKASLNDYMERTFNQTINAYVGTRLYPNLVWRLGVSERAFSLVLNLRVGLARSTTTFTVNNADMLSSDPKSWRDKYGDFYINSIVQGTALSVCWTFISQTRSTELEQARAAVTAFFAAPLVSFEVGCTYLARLAMEIPCQVYLYDAYYNETSLSSPATVLSAIYQRQHDDGAKQMVTVGIEPYRNLESLQSVSTATISSPVPPVALGIVRKEEAEYAFQASERQTALAIMDPTDAQFATWQAVFSSGTYQDSITHPGKLHGAATRLVHNYGDLFSRDSTAIVPRAIGWPAAYGTTYGLEQTLRWLRMSRQKETETIYGQV